MDLLRSLIIGPSGTPYEDAPFVIDWKLNDNFRVFSTISFYFFDDLARYNSPKSTYRSFPKLDEWYISIIVIQFQAYKNFFSGFRKRPVSLIIY